MRIADKNAISAEIIEFNNILIAVFISCVTSHDNQKRFISIF
jgi:hypothetical protein